MHHLFRRMTVPAVAAGVLMLPALGAAYAADPTGAASATSTASPAADDPTNDPAATDDPTATDAPTPPAGLLCNGAVPTKWATADNQTVVGTDGNDVISANGHHGLRLQGGKGNDVICGAGDAAGTTTNTTLDGGEGADTLISTGGRDRLIGGGGNDKIVGTINNDVLYSTDGYVAGQPGVLVNVAAGTATGAKSGADTLTGVEQARFFGSDGNDTFLGSDAANWFDGGAGADTIHGYGGDDWFHAVNPGIITGNAGNDTITVGYGGTVKGGKGDDTIAADPNNQLSGASPDSGTAVAGYTLSGQTGDDTFKVNTLKTSATAWSTDPALHWKGTIAGGKGTDEINFAWLSGHAGLRTSSAAGVAHWTLGSLTFSNAEKTVGTVGNDVLKGGAGDDILFGQEGDDTLRGKKGDDNLHGKQGNDTILGGRGDDKANGGKGTDTCQNVERAKKCEA